MKIQLFRELNLENFIELEDVDWSRKSNANFSKLHSTSSYLAMFCPSLPNYFIEKYSTQGELIMDNFSGRGTTALVCREKNRDFIGTDLNPYSFVLTKFKISNDLYLTEINNRIDELKNIYISEKIKWKEQTNNEIYNEVKNFYHDDVLSQLIFLREIIGKKWSKNNEIDNAILSIALGLMHGKIKKDNTTIYFSIDMPNTISMSPNYVKNYVLKNKLIKPKVDIFENIKQRMSLKFDKNIFNEKKYNGTILYADATLENENIKENSVSLVITSPPYLSIVDYRNSNWLKLWLLGYDRQKLKNEIKLSDNLKYNEYKKFIKKYLNAIHSKLKNGAKVCLIVGDVHEKKLIENIWKEIREEVNYKFVELYYDNKYEQNKKITNMLNKKKGKATIIEKVLVIEKNEN